jgi:hypothetical protein
MLLGWQPWRRDARGIAPTRRTWAGAAAIAAGFVIAFWHINGGFPGFPPADATSRLFYIALVLGVFGVAEAFMPASRSARAMPVLIIAASVLAALLRFKTQQWQIVQSIEVIGGLTILAALWWACFEAAADDRVRSASILMVGFAAAISLTLLLSDSLTFGKLGGAVTAAFAGVGICCFFPGSRVTLSRGAVTVFTLMTTLLAVASFYLANLRPIPAAMMAAAPLLTLTALLVPARKPRLRIVVRLLATFIPLAAAVALTVMASNREMAEPEDPYSGSYSG